MEFSEVSEITGNIGNPYQYYGRTTIPLSQNLLPRCPATSANVQNEF